MVSNNQLIVWVKTTEYIVAYPGIVAFSEEWDYGMNKDDNKLDHLELGEILLPPEVRLHLHKDLSAYSSSTKFQIYDWIWESIGSVIFLITLFCISFFPTNFFTRLFYITLFYIGLFYTTLFYIWLFCTQLFNIGLFYTQLFYIGLF